MRQKFRRYQYWCESNFFTTVEYPQFAAAMIQATFRMFYTRRAWLKFQRLPKEQQRGPNGIRARVEMARSMRFVDLTRFSHQNTKAKYLEKSKALANNSKVPSPIPQELSPIHSPTRHRNSFNPYQEVKKSHFVWDHAAIKIQNFWRSCNVRVFLEIHLFLVQTHLSIL
jgi:hypothetical protein